MIVTTFLVDYHYQLTLIKSLEAVATIIAIHFSYSYYIYLILSYHMYKPISTLNLKSHFLLYKRKKYRMSPAKTTEATYN